MFFIYHYGLTQPKEGAGVMNQEQGEGEEEAGLCARGLESEPGVTEPAWALGTPWEALVEEALSPVAALAHLRASV